MTYNEITEGIFLDRPNRFIAHVNIDGEIKTCHVKNTGRCKELLTEGARVLLSRERAATRKTEYDLVAVYKGDTLINIDSQAPCAVFGEWLKSCDLFGKIDLVRPETTYENSRFDFYIEADGRKIFAEIKGVTLERDGVLLFPDAPTERGAKHLRELAHAKKNGYDSYVFFIIQMSNCKYFTPNEETDPSFAAALREADAEGVNICALKCDVWREGMKITAPVKVVL